MNPCGQEGAAEKHVAARRGLTAKREAWAIIFPHSQPKKKKKGGQLWERRKEAKKEENPKNRQNSEMAEVGWMDEPRRSGDESSSESRATVIDATTGRQTIGQISVEPIMISKPRDPWGSASTASEPARIDDTLSTSTVTTAATEDPRMYLEDDSLRGIDEPKEPPKDIQVEFFPSPPAYETLFQTAKQPNGSVETGKSAETTLDSAIKPSDAVNVSQTAANPSESTFKPLEAAKPSETAANPSEIPKLTTSAIKSTDASGQIIDETKPTEEEDPNEQKKIVNISITTETTPTVKTVTFNEIPQIYSPPAPKSPEAAPRKSESRTDSIPKTAESRSDSAKPAESAAKAETPKAEEPKSAISDTATAAANSEPKPTESTTPLGSVGVEPPLSVDTAVTAQQPIIPTVTISPASESVSKPVDSIADSKPSEPPKDENSTATRISESAVAAAIESAVAATPANAESDGKSAASESAGAVPANSEVSAEPKSAGEQTAAPNDSSAISASNSEQKSADTATAAPTSEATGITAPSADSIAADSKSADSNAADAKPSESTVPQNIDSSSATKPDDTAAANQDAKPWESTTADSSAVPKNTDSATKPDANQNAKSAEANKPDETAKVSSPTESNASESISVHLADAVPKKPEDGKPAEAETPKPTEGETISAEIGLNNFETKPTEASATSDSQFGQIGNNAYPVAAGEPKLATEVSPIASAENPTAPNQTTGTLDAAAETAATVLADIEVQRFPAADSDQKATDNESTANSGTQWVTEPAASAQSAAANEPSTTVAGLSDSSAPATTGELPKSSESQWAAEPTPAATESSATEASAPGIIGEVQKPAENQWVTEPTASTPVAASAEPSSAEPAASTQWITDSAPTAASSESSAQPSTPSIIGEVPNSSGDQWITEPAAAALANNASVPSVVGEAPKAAESQWITESASNAANETSTPKAANSTETQWITESPAVNQTSTQNEPSTPKAAEKPSESQWITETPKSSDLGENRNNSNSANESQSSGAPTQWITEPSAPSIVGEVPKSSESQWITEPAATETETPKSEAEISKPAEAQWITETPNSNTTSATTETSTPKTAEAPKPAETQWITEPAVADSKTAKTENDEKSIAETLISETENTYSEVKPTSGLQKSVTVTDNLPNIRQIPDKKPKEETSPENESSINDDLDAYEQRLIQNTREALALVDKLCQESAERQRRRRHPSGDYQINRTTISPGADLDVETFKVSGELLDDPIDIVMIPAARLLILDRNLGLTLFDLESKEVKRCPPDAEWRSPDCGCWLRRQKQILVVYEQKVENEYRKHLAKFDADLKMLTKCEAPKYINDKVVTTLRICSADDTDAVYLAVNTPNDVFLYELNDKVRWTEVYNWRGKQCSDLQWLATVGPVTELLFVESTKRHVILLGIYESALAERAILAFCCEPTALCVDEERNLICFDRATNIVGVHSKLDFQRIRALTVVGHSQCALSAGSGNLALLHRERKELRICKY